MKRRSLMALAVLVLVLAGAGGVLYAFGTPYQPAPDATSGLALPAPEQPPVPEAQAPLAIQIPGCVCHSDDPALVEEHSRYRINQCASCHSGGVQMGR